MLSIVIGCGYSFLGLIHLFVAVPRLASLLTVFKIHSFYLLFCKVLI